MRRTCLKLLDNIPSLPENFASIRTKAQQVINDRTQCFDVVSLGLNSLFTIGVCMQVCRRTTRPWSKNDIMITEPGNIRQKERIVCSGHPYCDSFKNCDGTRLQFLLAEVMRLPAACGRRRRGLELGVGLFGARILNS